MVPIHRLLGGPALAVGVAIATFAATPAIIAVDPILFSTAARADEDAILFWRDPMGAPEIARAPKKDSMGMDFLPVRKSAVAPLLLKLPPTPATSSEPPLFWRDPMGGTEIVLAPKKDSMGMDFLPVRAADLAGLLPPLGGQAAPSAAAPKASDPAKRRVLYYRNPMGLADTSPTPKKDSMGMDYLPVYEGEDQESSVVTIAPGRIQRTGVRSEPAESRAIVARVQVPGTIQIDERRITVVATRSTAFVEKVASVTTGDLVKKGQTLLYLYSPEISAAAAQFASNPNFEGARARLLNLAVPPEALAEIERTRKAPLSIAWPAPANGIVLERAVVDGMKAEPGATLFRIADLSSIWALLDVSERDYGRLRFGQAVSVRARALPGRAFAGRITQIYPQINRETRTARVRVELANADLALRPDMYVEADIDVGDSAKVATVPDSAVIDSGNRQIVIIDLGEGRFEPRAVRTGARGEGRVEIREGVVAGDRVVTSANFLIDAESNLKAALKGLNPTEPGKEAGK